MEQTRKMTDRTIGLLAAVLAICMISGCRSHGSRTDAYGKAIYVPEYASGFEIAGKDGCRSTIIRTLAAWQGTDSTAISELFIARGGERPPEGFAGQTITGHASRIAAMSSSYIGLLSCIDACDSVTAISGKQFISDETVRDRIDDIIEAGSDADPDYEALLNAGTDLVLIYGIASSTPMEKKLKTLGIPYLYMGEYLETDPLGRAEWMVVLAEIIGDRKRGEQAFREICRRYDSLKTVAAGLAAMHRRPTVMLNAPYGDSWYMASPVSPVARMIDDAGGKYAYDAHKTNRSVPVSREEAFVLASGADIWLDTGSIGSIEELKRACPGFVAVKCVQEGKVYNNDARMSPGGGNEFWETSPSRPDMVLEDLIRIFYHMDGDKEDLHYYRRLE